MAERLALSAYWRVIRGNANVRRLWLAQIVSELGDWLYTVAIYEMLLEATGGKAKSIAFAFILQVLPQLVMSPVAGVLIDRLNRRRLMIFSDWARAVIVAMMLFAVAGKSIWLAYLLLVCETVFWAIFEPAHSAVIPNITRNEEETVAANSLSSITWSVNFAVGFSIGGFITAFAGRNAVFLLNAASFVASAILISRMRFEEPHTEAVGKVTLRSLFDFSPILEGLRYVAADARLFAILLVKTGLGVLGANWVVLTILGRDKFAVGSAGAAGTLGMSLLLSFRGIGAILGPIIGGYFTGSSQPRMRVAILFAFLASAAGYMGLAQVSTIPLAAACLLLAHAGSAIQWVNSTTILQLNTEDRFRGRVFSAEFAFMTLSMSVSSALAGYFLDAGVPVNEVTFAMGLAMLMPAVLWGLALRLWR